METTGVGVTNWTMEDYGLEEQSYNSTETPMAGVVSERDINNIPIPVRSTLVFTISVAIILSNLVNMLVLRLTDQIPAIARTCLLNLSLADLLVGVVACLPCIYPALTGKWIYGDVWCQLAGITHGTSVTISIYSLALISVDRYIAILHPLRYPVLMTHTKCYAIIFIMWLVASLTFASPLPTKSNFIYYQFGLAEVMCGLYWEYPWFCLITAVYIPMFAGSVLLYTTVKIVKAVSKMSQIHVIPQAQVGAKGTGGEGGTAGGGKVSKSDVKAIKVLIITTVVYFTMWGPYVTEVCIMSASSLRIPSEAMFATIWTANSNSFMNVIIYSVMYKSFRKNCVWVVRFAFAKLLFQVPPERPGAGLD